MRETKKTTCNRDCPDACGILADVEDGRIVRLRGDPEHPVTQGFLCYRTSHFLERQYSRERLKKPLLRKGGELVEVSWEEALDFAAERLLAIRRESGPAAIFHYRSGGSLGYVKAVADLFFERFGPCTTKRGDICNAAPDAAQLEDFGALDSNELEDIENARSVVLWGKNVYTSSPHTLPVLKRAKAKGARLLFIDPVHHKTARLCDEVLRPRPGLDLALALGAAAVVLEQGRAHPDAASWCEGLEGYLALVGSRSPETWARLADVPLAALRTLAAAYSEGAPCTTLVGWGMGRRKRGAATVRAIDALACLTGNVGVAGAGVSAYFARKAAADLSFLEERPPRTVCEPLFGQELLAAKDPPIRAVWITAGNPVTMLPESETTARALAQTELVVVVDPFLTDTARRATLVLPTTTLLEEDDVLGAYGHHTLGVARPVVPPPEGVRSDLQILQGVAERTGLGDVLAGTAREWQERIVGPRLASAGLSLDDLERGPVRSPFSPRVAHEGRRFQTPSGKARLLQADEVPSLEELEKLEELEEEDDARFPLLLHALSTPDAQCSQWARPQVGPLEARVHPSGAGGVPDGALAQLESELGALLVRVRHDDQQRPDVLIVPKGGHLDEGRCANALVRARITDRGEGGALYDERVRLAPLPTG